MFISNENRVGIPHQEVLLESHGYIEGTHFDRK